MATEQQAPGNRSGARGQLPSNSPLPRAPGPGVELGGGLVLRVMLVFTACDPSKAGSSGDSRGQRAGARGKSWTRPHSSQTSLPRTATALPRGAPAGPPPPRAALAVLAEPQRRKNAKAEQPRGRRRTGCPRGLSPTSGAGQRQRFLRAPTRSPRPRPAAAVQPQRRPGTRPPVRTTQPAGPLQRPRRALTPSPAAGPASWPPPSAPFPPSPPTGSRSASAPPETPARCGPRALRVPPPPGPGSSGRRGPRAARGSGPTLAPTRSARDVALPGLPRTRGSPGPKSRPRGARPRRSHAARGPSAPAPPRPPALTEDLPRVLLGAYAAAQLPLANPDLQLQRGRVRERTAPLGHGRGPAAAPFSRAPLAATRDVTAARRSGAAQDRPGTREEAGLESGAARDRLE